MKQKASVFYYLMLSALFCATDASAAGIRVGNLTRSNAQGYQRVNEMRYNSAANTVAAQQEMAPMAPAELPIHVTNQDLANQIQSSHADAPVTVEQLERCSMIYPDGKFEWAGPTLGRAAGGASTCTAVVEMRAYQAGPDGKDLVVARANLPAGESVRCNISDFPSATLLEDAGKIEFPADNEPTVEDVIAVMNQEQKQNAGLKIAAGTILFGVAGNMIGKNEPGKTGLLGVGEDKLKTTAIGALGGAALMVGHTQTGKVAGDTILSAGVNATAGAVVGNMVATGEPVLRVEKCIILDEGLSKNTAETAEGGSSGVENLCVWGVAAKGKNFTGKGEDGTGESGDVELAAFYNIRDEHTYLCKIERNGDGATEYTNCRPRELVSITLGCESGQTLDQLQARNFDGYCEGQRYELKEDSYKGRYMVSTSGGITANTFIMIESAKVADDRKAAMVIIDSDSAFGYKKKDWDKVKKDHIQKGAVYLRDNNNAGYLPKDGSYSLEDFYPMYRNAEDGSLIDFGNKARLKSTLTGAGIGGVMGAFSGYQGAKKDVEERWVTAVREYKDSLSKVYCATGTRFLSQYNDIVTIPALNTEPK